MALGEHLAYGPESVRARIAQLGAIARGLLADVPDWTLVEEIEEPSAITTLAPGDGVDPAAVREWLLNERRILTTFVGVVRAPLELTGPRLRISPHVDSNGEDLEVFAEALIAATRDDRVAAWARSGADEGDLLQEPFVGGDATSCDVAP